MDSVTLREWITDPGGDPGDIIRINNVPHTRQQLLDDLPLADAAEKLLSRLRERFGDSGR